MAAHAVHPMEEWTVQLEKLSSVYQKHSLGTLLINDLSADCPNGKYGAGCTQICHCVNGCDGATGECHNGGCLQGWSGSKCNVPDSCEDGFYGELCNYKCPCSDGVCNKTTGSCSNGECAIGWFKVYKDCQRDGSLKIWFLYNIKVNPGELTSIICEVGRNPSVSPDDVALIDQSGIPITRTSHYVRGMYISVSNYSSVPVDNGLQYTCRVGNQAKQLKSFDKYVLPKFSLSNKPAVKPKATQVTVTWDKWREGIDFGDGPVEAYAVYYKKTAHGDWTAHQNFTLTNPDQTTYSADIAGLDWSTVYDFTVTVRRPGSKGEGSKDTYTTTTTLCDVPTEGPKITGATSGHPNTLLVNLTVSDPTKIKCDRNGGYIKSFHWRYRKANTQDKYGEKVVYDGGARTFTIHGLLAFTEYELMVSFNNRDEQSPWSSVHTARTAEDVPSKPRNVTLIPAVSTMQLIWVIPAPTNGIIKKYLITYWETDNETTTWEQKEVTENLQDVNTYLISNLTYKVSYTVQVSAFTSPGPGNFSDTVNASTTDAIPGKPRSLEVIDTKEKEIKLSWVEPFPFRGNIICYEISYRSTESVFKTTELRFESFPVHIDGTAYILEDLSPGTIYEIKVNASTERGFGEAATLFAGTSFTVDIPAALPITEDIKNDINQYGTVTRVSLPSVSDESGISEETQLIDYVILLEYDQNIDKRGKRDIDASRLGGYNETGPAYYITALLPLKWPQQKFYIGDGGVYGGYTNVPLTIGRQYSVYYGLKSQLNGEPFYHFDERPSIRVRAGVTKNVYLYSSTASIVVSVVALVVIVCLVVVLVSTIRRQNKRKGSKEYDIINLWTTRGPMEEDVSRQEMKDEQDKPQARHHDGVLHYACVNVLTQNSSYLASSPNSQERREDDDEGGTYIGLVKELQSESEYTTLSTTVKHPDIKH
ncbi:receptor-type tyrosine-protein phosphatase mu-like isoform X2 [Ptychodera flava]|uniref:receptor-type tyrosine-protein phosphatase mu-like isoform X2 n=1 Tax=Ptychodera flava TaxID=63121 RepID=UPI00396A1582